MVTCQEEVEAALLNSQGEPVKEVFAALSAVAKFAREEVEVSEEGFFVMARQAWRSAGE